MKSEYTINAEAFMKRHGIKMRVIEIDNSCPPFCDGKHIHGNKHRVTLSGNGKRIQFYFWNSFNDANEGKLPDAYDVLSCASSDLNCPDTFEDFCSEFGYDQDSRKAEATFKACRVQSEKLQRIFDDEVIQAELGTIN